VRTHLLLLVPLEYKGNQCCDPQRDYGRPFQNSGIPVSVRWPSRILRDSRETGDSVADISKDCKTPIGIADKGFYSRSL